MPRPQFESVTVSAPRESLTVVNQSIVTSVASNGSESVTIYAPANKVATLLALTLKAPAVTGATTGGHVLRLVYSNPTLEILRGEAPYNASLAYERCNWDAAATSAKPADVSAQALAVKGLQFDDSVGLTIAYNNFTDQPQNGTRNIFMTVIEREVG